MKSGIRRGGGGPWPWGMGRGPFSRFGDPGRAGSCALSTQCGADVVLGWHAGKDAARQGLRGDPRRVRGAGGAGRRCGCGKALPSMEASSPVMGCINAMHPISTQLGIGTTGHLVIGRHLDVSNSLDESAPPTRRLLQVANARAGAGARH